MTAHTYHYNCVGGRRGPDGNAVLVWETRCRVCKLLFKTETGNPPDRDAVACICEKCQKQGRPTSAKGYSAMRRKAWLRSNL